MRLLVLGGTKFLGRAVVDAALARGHDVTLFNRGETNAGLYPEAEKLRGDRDGGLDALGGREWDAAVDTTGYVPRVVRASAELLRDAVGHYGFVSTVGVYADLAAGPREDAPTEGDVDTEDVTAAYGPLKAACERVVQEVLGDRASLVRPGLIVGPHDPTYRFTYWVERIAAGGDVLAPGPRGARVQVIDVRDLGDLLVRGAEDRLSGPYNAVGPAGPLTMEELLETIRAATGSDARLHWADPAFLQREGVQEWSELPLWIVDPDRRGMLEADNTRALAAGLRLRPLAETVRDTLAWARSGASTLEPLVSGRLGTRPGLDADRERELLASLA